MTIAPVRSRARALLLVGACMLFFARLGATDLWAPDEPRYAQVAEELRSMRHGSGGLVLLHLNDAVYTQKPPLYFWLAALVGWPEGRVTEVAARLPSAVAGFGMIALTVALGARLLGGTSGLLGAALLLTTFEFARAARRAQLDVVLALFETLALFAFWRLDRRMGSKAWNQAALHASLGLALLTKGPVGFLVPLLVIVGFLAWERRLRDLRLALPLWGFVLSLGPILAWLAAAVAWAPQGFFGDAVVENVIGRFFSGTSHIRPVYYYLYQFPIEFLPWIVLGPLAVRVAAGELTDAAGEERQRAVRFTVAWLVMTLLFFTLSSGKRGVYLLPALPAAALLTGHALALWVTRERRIPLSFHAATALLGAGVVGAAGYLALRDPISAPQTALLLGAAAIALAIGTAAFQVVATRVRAPLRWRLAAPIVATLGIELAVFTFLFPALDPQKSPRPIAQAAATLTPPGSPIGLVGDRALAGGLVYYSERDVAELKTPTDIEQFWLHGGQAIVTQRRKLDRIEAVLPVVVRFSARGGRRELVVVTPRRVTNP